GADVIRLAELNPAELRRPGPVQVVAAADDVMILRR
ncbi:MAG: hypothetical protein RLZZ179_838, partial [Verrucomicrobiota bacterium]